MGGQWSPWFSWFTALAKFAITFGITATDLYQWKGGYKTAAMQRYEGLAFGELSAALDRLDIRFKDSSDATGIIVQPYEAHQKRHRIRRAVRSCAPVWGSRGCALVSKTRRSSCQRTFALAVFCP